MRMDALHYALLAVLVLLVFYAASTYGLFKEGAFDERRGLPKGKNFGSNVSGMGKITSMYNGQDTSNSPTKPY